MDNNNCRGRKIFVGGLFPELTEDEFKNYFENFGRIIDVVVMRDSVTNRPRGFGFITFESAESVDSVLNSQFHELNGKLVEVKRAIPKMYNNSNVPPSHYGSGYPVYDPPFAPYNYQPYDFYGGNFLINPTYPSNIGVGTSVEIKPLSSHAKRKLSADAVPFHIKDRA